VIISKISFWVTLFPLENEIRNQPHESLSVIQVMNYWETQFKAGGHKNGVAY
jgi:hypothetical protein